jgi:hypothetical protein
MFIRFSIILSCFLALQAGSGDAPGVVHVAIDGLHSDKGQVFCSLYSSADGFPKNDTKAIAHSKSPSTTHHAECTFAVIHQAPTLSPYFTTKTRTENLIRTSSGSRVKVWGRPTTPRATSVHRVFTMPPLPTQGAAWM